MSETASPTRLHEQRVVPAAPDRAVVVDDIKSPAGGRTGGSSAIISGRRAVRPAGWTERSSRETSRNSMQFAAPARTRGLADGGISATKRPTGRRRRQA
jgi:hypothetical protein